MISGDKFFVVSNAGNTYFTRAGDFTTDLDGAIVTQSGANVMGWKADADGNIIKDRVQALYATSPEYTYTAPAATTGVTITGNVDSRETGLEKPETLVTEFEEPADVIIFDGFKDMAEEPLKELYLSLIHISEPTRH